MRTDAKKFLISLIKTPSPTGFEEPVQRLVKRYMEPYVDEIDSDLHGNLILRVNSKAKRKVMLAGHCDQIGFMIRNISKDGFLYVVPLGGIDAGVLPGAKVVIHSKTGVVPGFFGRKPIHHQSANERGKQTTELDKLWIDIGAKDDKEALKLVSIGDPVTFDLEVTELIGTRIVAPGLDDKVGLFVVLETLRQIKRRGLAVQVVGVSTVQEEIGVRGAQTAAFAVDPEIGISIDVTHASDNPGCDEKNSLPCALGKGPLVVKGPNVNPVVYRRLEEAAKKNRIPFQPGIAGGVLGTDARAIQVSRQGVATGHIGIPNRYMHTQAEVVDLADLDNAAKLLARFIESITERTSFKPV